MGTLMTSNTQLLTEFTLQGGRLIDLEVLGSMTGYDDRFMQQLIGMFLSSAPDTLEQAQEALKENDKELVRSVVHKYKSSLNILGNTKLPALAADIEQMARNDAKTAVLAEKLQQLSAVTYAIMDELRAELKRLEAA